MLARLKRFSFISIPNDRQFVKRVSEKILMDFAILRGIRSLRAEKTASAAHRAESAEAHSFQAPADIKRLPCRNPCAEKHLLFHDDSTGKSACQWRKKSPRIVRDSGGDNAYRSPLRPRLRLTRRTGCPAFFFAPDAFVRATGLLAGALSTRTGVPPRRILPSLPMTTG